MDEQNKGVKERWGQTGHIPERGYAAEDRATEQRAAEIRSDIDQTRAEMSETVDAIQERLRPSNIVSSATESVRNATVGKVKDMARSARETLRGEGGADYGRGYRVMDRVRDNPIPTAIAAASVAWIAFSGRRPRPRMRPAIYGSTRDGEAFVRETVIADPDDRESDFEYDRAGMTARTQSTVGDFGRRMQRATSNAQTGVQRFIRENPLAAAAVAAAVGATIGLALPETERENQLMGEARDSVVDRAKEAARDAAERVQDTAERVKEVAGDAARKMTGDQ